MTKRDAKIEAKRQQLCDQRLKDRIINYIQYQMKVNDQIVAYDEISAYLKREHHEYNRTFNDKFVQRIKVVIDALFAEVNGTNIKKGFYKRKDLLFELVGKDEDEKFEYKGEELMEHTSKNTMNDMILNNNAEHAGDKRSRSEAGKDEADGSQAQKRRKKQPASLGDYQKGKEQSQKAEELLNGLRVEPGHDFSEIGGLADTIKQLREMIEWPLKYENIFEWLGVKPPRGILISGPAGTGKTMLAMSIAGEFPDVPFYKLSAPEIVSSLSGQSEEKIRQVFQGVREKAPAVIFIDELDSIAGKRESANKDMEVRIVAQLASCLDELEKSGERVIVIGVTSRPETIDQGLRRAGRFEREITIGVPNEEARIEIFEKLTKGMRLRKDFPFKDLVSSTPGYVGADLQTLCKEASIIAVERVIRSTEKSEPKVEEVKAEAPNAEEQKEEKESESEDDIDLEKFYIEVDDFQKASKHVKPSAQREGFSTVPNTSWKDVGALVGVREELKMSIVEPILNPQMFKDIGLSAPAGVLLYGPPGCGKTLVARAVSNESKANFISIKGPELLNKYVGESEKAVRQLFKRANSSAPCVIFFDELDSLCPKRGSENNTSSERVVNQLLTEMDGLEERRGVFVIAATNRPDIIDPAMLRPGRLDKLLYVPLPTKEDRYSILKTVCRNIPVGEDVDLKKVAYDTHCEGYSGADLSALVREAQMTTLRALVSKQAGISAA